MNIPNHPNSYGQMCTRLSTLDIDNHSSSGRIEDDDGDIVIAIDSTGIKVTNRGQYRRDMWHIRKKGYLKIHIAANVKTKEMILSLEVTDKKVHDDAKVMDNLLENILNNNNININSVLADGWFLRQ